MVAGYVGLERLGPVAMRGGSSPVTAFRVTGSPPAARRWTWGIRRHPPPSSAAPAISPPWGTCSSGLRREGQVVGIVGEPGMGKSRIVAELRRSLAAGRRSSRGGASPTERAVPYVPLADIVRANCAIADGDSPAEVETKAAYGLAELGIDPGPRPAAAADDGGGRRRRGAAEGSARRRSSRGPSRPCWRCASPAAGAGRCCWWSRTSTGSTATPRSSCPPGGDIPGAEPILSLCTYRPGYQAPWMRASYATQLALPRLALAESLVVLRALLGREAGSGRSSRSCGRRTATPSSWRSWAGLSDGEPERPGAPACPGPCTTCCWRASIGWRGAARVLQAGLGAGARVPAPAARGRLGRPGGLDPHLRELRRLEFMHEQEGDGRARLRLQPRPHPGRRVREPALEPAGAACTRPRARPTRRCTRTASGRSMTGSPTIVPGPPGRRRPWSTSACSRSRR